MAARASSLAERIDKVDTEVPARTSDLNQVEVSVVIPTRNRRRQLLRTVASVLRQREVASEIIVVDDASSDGTAASLAALHPGRVRIVTLDRRRGQSHARNVGFQAATAPWIALLDDDDLWSPNKLREQLDTAAEQGRDWVYSSMVVVDDGLQPLDVVRAPAPDLLLPRLLRRNVLGGGASNVCLRSELLQECGGYDEALDHLGDWDLWIRLAATTSAAQCPPVHAAYVCHAGNQIFVQRAGPEAELEHLAEKHHQLLRQHDVSFDRTAIRRWAPGRHHHAGRRGTAARLYWRNAIRYQSLGDLVRAAASLVPQRTPAGSSMRATPELAPAWLIAQRPEWIAAQGTDGRTSLTSG